MGGLYSAMGNTQSQRTLISPVVHTDHGGDADDAMDAIFANKDVRTLLLAISPSYAIYTPALVAAGYNLPELTALMTAPTRPPASCWSGPALWTGRRRERLQLAVDELTNAVPDIDRNKARTILWTIESRFDAPSEWEHTNGKDKVTDSSGEMGLPLVVTAKQDEVRPSEKASSVALGFCEAQKMATTNALREQDHSKLLAASLKSISRSYVGFAAPLATAGYEVPELLALLRAPDCPQGAATCCSRSVPWQDEGSLDEHISCAVQQVAVEVPQIPFHQVRTIICTLALVCTLELEELCDVGWYRQRQSHPTDPRSSHVGTLTPDKRNSTAGAFNYLRNRGDDQLSDLEQDSPTMRPRSAMPSASDSRRSTVAMTADEPKPIKRQGTNTRLSKATDPDVVLSYSSVQTDFMKEVRAKLRESGLVVTDGSEVPPGMDWRRYFFHMASRAQIFVPILSAEYLFSGPCEEVHPLCAACVCHRGVCV